MNIVSLINNLLILAWMTLLSMGPVAIILLFLYVCGWDLRKTGINYDCIFVGFAVWGMVGGLVSWAISKIYAKFIMKVQIIEPNTHDARLGKVLMLVRTNAIKAGLKDIPDAGYYVSDEINAFASGPTKSDAIIAVSTGLINNMNDAQLEGVIGHEIAHIRQGDMVTMTVMQGVANAMIMFIARLITNMLEMKLRIRDTSGSPIIVHFFEVTLGILGIMAINNFSRSREFRADAGSARLVGKDKIIDALKVLLANSSKANYDQTPSLASFKIAGNTTAFRRLLATHPPLEERIRRLENMPEEIAEEENPDIKILAEEEIKEIAEEENSEIKTTDGKNIEEIVELPANSEDNKDIVSTEETQKK